MLRTHSLLTDVQRIGRWTLGSAALLIFVAIPSGFQSSRAEASAPVTATVALSSTATTTVLPGSYTVTAIVTDNGAPVANVLVRFDVNSGPNAEMCGGTGLTDENGQVAMTCAGTDPGAETYTAQFVDSNGLVHVSDAASNIWTAPISG